MESQRKDPQVATENREYHLENKRTLEFLLLAAVIGIGLPIATLMGARAGSRTASEAYPAQAVSLALPEVDYKSIVMGTPGDEEHGKALFQNSCAACHGPDADGKGAAAAALKPPPRSFVDPAAAWSHGLNPLEIYHTISHGSPGTSMPGFAVSLSVQDRWALVHYLSALPGVKGRFQPVDEAIAASWRPEKAD